MSEANKLAEYLGFEVVYLDGFGYIQEYGEQGTEIKRESTLEERTMWTDLVRLSAELETLKTAISEAEPVVWANPNGGFLSDTYINQFATGLEKQTHTIPLYTLKGIK